MDELRKLIDENRQLFDTAEPTNGHFERFEKRLNLQNKPNRKINWTAYLKVASVAVLMVISALYVKEHLFDKKQLTETPKSEFNEARDYYVKIVDQRIDKIEELGKSMTPEQNQLLLDEMTHMDQMYVNLQKQLKATPDDPRVIQAMLGYYQMKVDILNRIINDLNSVQQLNSPNHENVQL